MPSISDLGFTLNRRDIDMSYNSAVSDLTGVVENDVSSEDVDTGAQMPDSSIPSDKISELNVEKLTTGTIYSRQITLGITNGSGDVYIGAGTFTASTWTCGNGFLMGIDDSDSNKVKFFLGDATNSIDWNVSAANTLTVKGTLVAGEIHIPDLNTTANSFHVESDGSGWIGATSTNRATAPIQWTAAGVWDVGNGTTYMRMDGPNGIFKSSNYVADSAGFQITTGGLAEFENIRARGSLYGSVFKYDVVSAVGGQLLVTNADSLSTAMTALDASTMTIVGNTTFAANDMLLIRAVASGGIQEEYLRVTSAASAPTYSVTRDLAAAYSSNSNPAWGAGTAVVKIGESDGAATYSGGWLRLLGEGTNAPYYSVFSRTGVAYNSSSERVRMGNLNGIGGFAADTYGIFAGNYSAGQYMSYDDISGDLIVNGSQLTNEALFGDGSDGDATISSNASLTSDTFYNNLTITSSASLTTNGYRLFVRGTLTIGTGCYLLWNGNAGGSGGSGTSGTATGAGSTAGTGGSAGTAGAALSDGSVPGSLAGSPGKGGIDGQTLNTTGSTLSNAGHNGDNGSSQAKCMVSTASNGSAGGNAGSNTRLSDGNVQAGASGGTGGSAGTNSSTILNEIKAYASAYLLYDPQDGTWYNTAPSNGGSGGGARPGSRISSSAGTTRIGQGGSGGSGGSGSSGGTVPVFARIIVNDGAIEARGGAGGNGGNAGDCASYSNNPADDGGSGGAGGGAGGTGGSGGVLLLVYSSYSGSGTTSVAGGAGGSGGTGGAGTFFNDYSVTSGSNGAAGNAGPTGTIIQLQV